MFKFKTLELECRAEKSCNYKCILIEIYRIRVVKLGKSYKYLQLQHLQNGLGTENAENCDMRRNKNVEEPLCLFTIQQLVKIQEWETKTDRKRTIGISGNLNFSSSHPILVSLKAIR